MSMSSMYTELCTEWSPYLNSSFWSSAEVNRLHQTDQLPGNQATSNLGNAKGIMNKSLLTY